MQRAPLIAIALSLLCPTGLHARSGKRSVERFNLAQLLARVREHHPSREIARARLNAAEHQLLKARLAWIPYLRGQISYAPLSDIRCVMPEAFRQVQTADGGTLYDLMNSSYNRQKYCLGTDIDNTVGDYFRNLNMKGYLFEMNLRLTQPVYLFGRIQYATRLAKAGVAAEKLKGRMVSHGLAQDVHRAYWDLKLARAMAATLGRGERLLSRLQKHVAETLERDDGSVDLTDRYRLRIRIADHGILAARIRRAEQLALAALRALLGQPARDRRRPAPDVDLRPLQPLTVKVAPLAHYLKLARTHRPEIRLLEVAVRAARDNVRLQYARFLPKAALILNLTARYTSSTDDPASAYLLDYLHGVGFGFSLGLEWNLDFQFQYSGLAKARAILLTAMHGQNEVAAGVRFQIATARSALEAATRRVEIVARARQAGSAWLDTMEKRFAQKKTKARDVANALGSWTRAEHRYLRAVHALNLAAADLSRAVGTSITAPAAKGR